MATKVTSSLINSISASQIQAGGATAGQVLTYNNSTSTWVASAAPGSGLLGSAGAVAWVNFNGYNGVIRASYNVSSVTLNNPVSGVLGGDYTINFATPLVDSNYAVTAFGSAYGRDSSVGAYGLRTATDMSNVPTKMDTTGVRIVGGGKYGFAENASQQTVTVIVFR